MSTQRKHHTPDQIIRILCHADCLLAEGKTAADVCPEIEGAEQTYYRWRNQYGGMKADEAMLESAMLQIVSGVGLQKQTDEAVGSPVCARELGRPIPAWIDASLMRPTQVIILPILMNQGTQRGQILRPVSFQKMLQRLMGAFNFALCCRPPWHAYDWHSVL